MSSDAASISNDPARANVGAFGARRIYAIQECVRSALLSIRAHGLRSFLTMLGIAIGIAAVIGVVSLMEGLTRSVTDGLRGIGSTTLTVRSHTSRESQLRGQVNRLRETDLDQLRLRIDGIGHITPFVFAGQRFGSPVHNGVDVAYGQLYGTTASYQEVFNAYPRVGRFLTKYDDDSRRRVVVLGEQMRKDLALRDNPVGQFIQIGGEWFKVVGVMEARGEIFGLNQDAYLLMPYQTALAMTGVISQPDLWISFTVADPENVDTVKQQVTALMRQLHGIKNKKDDDFVVEAPEQIARTIEDVSLTLTFVVAGIVGISLLVGGVGIMNIMLVSVTERTREIGIAKALGAPRSYILTQFLIESMVLAIIGGIIGIAVGFALAFGLSRLIAGAMPSFPVPTVPWWAILGSFAFSAAIGMVFGIVPASRAANLQPIEALRYE